MEISQCKIINDFYILLLQGKFHILNRDLTRAHQLTSILTIQCINKTWNILDSYPSKMIILILSHMNINECNVILQNIPVPRTMTWFNGILLPTTQICAAMPENNKTVYWMFSTSDIKLLKYRWFLTSALVLVKVNFWQTLPKFSFLKFCECRLI